MLGDVHYDRIDFHYDGADRLSLLPRPCQSIGGYAEAAAAVKNILCGFHIKERKTFRSSRGIVNGVKMIFGGNCRWLLMRASETENMIRFYAEGQTDAEVSSLLSNGKTLLISLSDKKE